MSRLAPTRSLRRKTATKGSSFFWGGEWDLALIDLNLPGTDGIELIQKGRERFSELPMMAVTGSTNNLMIDGAIRAGADYVLNKPVDRDELLRKIREFVKVEGTDADPPAASTSDVTPVEAAAAARIPTIVAVGVQPGDVEMGCGGVLFRHRAEGHQVIILNLAGGGDADSDLAAAAAQAAEVLGARMTNIGDGGTPDPERASSLLQSVFADSGPGMLYVPSAAAQSHGSVESNRLALAAAEAVPNVLAY